VLNSLLYAREPRHPMVQQMRFNFRLFWATPHKISTWNVFDPDYFAWMQLFGCLVQHSIAATRLFERLPGLPNGEEVPNHFARRQYCLIMTLMSEEDKGVVEAGPFFKLSHKQWPDYNLCKSEGVRGQMGGRAAKQKLCRAVARSNGTAMSILQYFLRRGGEAVSELPSDEKHAHSSRVSRAAAVTVSATRLPFTSPAEQAAAVRMREVGRLACGVWPPWDDHGHILSSPGPEKGVR